MKKINKKTSYTIKELKDMGFAFDLNGNLLTPTKEEECLNRYIKYREEKLIEKACEWLKENANDYLDWYDWERCRVSVDELLHDFKKAMEE